ncbi:MAG: hypothetical protein LBC74_04835 [Planctomycetaceae bacterium]|nr:hypothetical protein [Planctomycetaceae bacterium]
MCTCLSLGQSDFAILCQQNSIRVKGELIFRLILVLFVLFFVYAESYGGIGDCLWGGSNEETAYSTPFVQSGTSLAQANQPPLNIGAPLPSIPVQATPATRATLVPQSNIPTISPITGNVGTIGQPATGIIPTTPIQAGSQISTANNAGVEILYVLPSGSTSSPDICIEGEHSSPMVATTVVAAGTPGAIPVAVKTITAYRPRVEYRLKFAPIKQKTETLVRVIDPRTKRVVKTYCEKGEQQITTLPVLHWEEVVFHETVTVKMGTPIKQNYPQNYTPTPNNKPTPQTQHRVLYLDQQTDSQNFSTDIF